MADNLLVEVRNQVAIVTLNRPEVRNAFDDALIADLTQAFEEIEQEDSIRAMVLTGAGKAFCAGADLNWMKRMSGYGYDENLADARALAKMLKTLAMGTLFAAALSVAPLAAAPAAAQGKDVVDTAVAAGSFKPLAKALAAAGLVDTPKGPGPFTVFAPTDEAFAKLPPGTLETLLKPENKTKLARILTYHVVAGRVMAADAAKLTSAKAMSGDSLTIAGLCMALALAVPSIGTKLTAPDGTVLEVVDASPRRVRTVRVHRHAH